MYDAVRTAMGIQDEGLDEFNPFKGTDNASVKEQDPK